MKHFILFFDGQEGSSSIMDYLKNFDQINTIGFEPFDKCHLKRNFIDADFSNILELIFNNNIKDAYTEQIMKIYKKYSIHNIYDFDKNKSIGLKMRFRDYEILKPILIKYNIVAFVLIRSNLLKFAFSRSKPLSLQFDLIDGKIDASPITHLNLDTFSNKLSECKIENDNKQKLINTFIKDGITCYPVYYEHFCHDKKSFFRNILNKLTINIPDIQIEIALNKGTIFKKVHENIIDSIINKEEFINYLITNNLIAYL